MLLVVAESEGSSPGRAGFKMAIATAGALHGSIGGGIMEVKLAELGKKLLQESAQQPFIKKQVHSKNVALNQSGMICSGEQTILYFLLTTDHEPVVGNCIDQIQLQKKGILTIGSKDHIASFTIDPDVSIREHTKFEKEDDANFIYRENLGYPDHLYIIGGGHCALALSDLMSKLHFYIHVWDDRPHLNTMEQNMAAHEKKTLDSYVRTGDNLPSGDNIYVVVMTQGYRSDLEVLLSMKNNSFGYLGVLGSETKINLLRNELEKNNFPVELAAHMHAPIGIKINSHTPEEIAVSIAAEIIRHRNNKRL